MQSFTLHLNDLKEYEITRQKRNSSRQQAKLVEVGTSTSTSTTWPQQPPPIAKVGPKSKQEIRERIGLNME